MFELNDQELEQVAGGRKLKSISTSDGAAGADLGAVKVVSSAGSVSTHCFDASWTKTVAAGIGDDVVVQSEAASQATSK